MSALALLYASTGDSIYKNKGDSLVAGARNHSKERPAIIKDVRDVDTMKV